MSLGSPLCCETVEPAEGSGRVDPRTNMFMAATLHIEGAPTPTPAKIRNLSATGAMVEGPVLPSAGSTVQLVRGGLSTSATVLWQVGNRCGLSFAGSVSVQAWMAPPGKHDQQRVDPAVALVRPGAVVPEARWPARTTPVVGIDDERMARDLALVGRLLDALGAALAEDPEIVRRHIARLQLLDIAGQTLAALAQSIGAGGGEGLARLDDLRRSCDRALDATA